MSYSSSSSVSGNSNQSLSRQQSSSNQSSNSYLLQSSQSELAQQLAALAAKYGDQVFQWAQSTLGPNSAVTNAAINQYFNAANNNFNAANNYNNTFQNEYQPQMQQLSNEAGSYSSGARQQVMAGQAESASLQGSQAGLDQAKQNLQSYGVNPNSGVYQELIQSQQAARGAAAAGSGTTAALNTQNTGRSLLGQSVNVGMQLPAASVNASNAGTNAVSGAENASLANTTTGATALGAAEPYYQAAINLKYPNTGTSSTGSSSSSGYSVSSGGGGSASNSSSTPYVAKGGAIPHFAGGGFGAALDTPANQRLLFESPMGNPTHGWLPSGVDPESYQSYENALQGGALHYTMDPNSQQYQNELRGGALHGVGPNNWMHSARGGAIPGQSSTGGHISKAMSPSGGAQTDDVNAKLNAGEFVIPKDVAAYQGQKFFQDLIKKSRAAMGSNDTSPAKPEMGPDNNPGPPSFVSQKFANGGAMPRYDGGGPASPNPPAAAGAIPPPFDAVQNAMLKQELKYGISPYQTGVTAQSLGLPGSDPYMARGGQVPQFAYGGLADRRMASQQRNMQQFQQNAQMAGISPFDMPGFQGGLNNMPDQTQPSDVRSNAPYFGEDLGLEAGKYDAPGPEAINAEAAGSLRSGVSSGM